MKNGNRYYNQPLYAILKRNHNGEIMGYCGRVYGWLPDKVYVFDEYATESINIRTGKKQLSRKLAEDKKFIEKLLKDKELPIGDGDDVFFVRLRSKKCPIKVDFPKIYSHKNPYLRESEKDLPFKVLTR